MERGAGIQFRENPSSLKPRIIIEMKSQLERIASKRNQFEHKKANTLARDFEAKNLLIELENCKVTRRTSQNCFQASPDRFR
jgi:hypothetical protein